jgi:hypothetical protein
VTEIEWDTSASGLGLCCESTRNDINATKKQTKALMDASKETGLGAIVSESRAKLTQYQRVRCLENVTQYKYLETTLRNRRLIQEVYKVGINYGNAC